MRAEIQLSHKRGFLSSYYEVHVTVYFTDTERHLLERERMGDWIVMDRTPRQKALRRYKNEAEFKRDQGRYALRVQHLLDGTDTFEFDHLLQTQEYQLQLEEKLEIVQANLDSLNQGFRPTSREF